MNGIANEEGQARQRPALRIARQADTPFTDPSQAALALLNIGCDLTWKAGQFLGGVAVSQNPLSEKQLAWLAKLLERAGLPPLADGGEHG